MIEIIAWAVLIIVFLFFVLPMSVFLCVKLGVLGYLRAIRNPNQEESDNGKPRS